MKRSALYKGILVIEKRTSSYWKESNEGVRMGDFANFSNSHVSGASSQQSIHQK